MAFEIPEDVKEMTGLDEKIYTDFDEATKEYEKALTEGNIEAQKEALENKLKISKDIVNQMLDKTLVDKTNEIDKTKVLNFINDFNDKNATIEKAIEGVNALDKNTNPTWKSFKSLFTSSYEKVKSYFFETEEMKNAKNDVSNSLKKLQLDPSNESAQAELKQKVEKLQNLGEKDTNAKEKAEASGMDWKTALALFASLGAIIGLFWYAHDSSGCYMNVVEGESTHLTSCDEYYSQSENQQYCSCGEATSTNPKDPTRDANYPYYKCKDAQGKICGDLTKKGDIMYSYKEYNFLTIIPEIAKDIAKDAGGAASSFLDSLTGPLKIVFYVLLGIFILYILLKMFFAFTEKKES